MQMHHTRSKLFSLRDMNALFIVYDMCQKKTALGLLPPKKMKRAPQLRKKKEIMRGKSK